MKYDLPKEKCLQLADSEAGVTSVEAGLPPVLSSASFATCKIAFDLECDGLPTTDEDEMQDALLDIKGDGWEACEYDGSGIHGTFLIFEFDHIPTPAEVETVKARVNEVLNTEVSSAD